MGAVIVEKLENPFADLQQDDFSFLDGEITFGAGASFGHYQQLHLIGEGGVAEVWRARHLHPNHADAPLALKILSPSLSRDPKIVELFRHEAYLLSLLKHPNIVATHEAGTLNERLFIAMNYIQGRDLDRLLLRCEQANQVLPIPFSIHLVLKVLMALCYAHELKDHDGRPLDIVHRDIHPTNIFLGWDGAIKLGDFGVAAITTSDREDRRALFGKAGYFAPEQLEGGAVDQRSDLFSVGALLYELVCNQPAFQAADTKELLRLNKKAKVISPRKLNPVISKGLEKLILKALDRRPKKRFQSARDMGRALQELVAPSVNMSLCVAALMRSLFTMEFAKQLKFNAELTSNASKAPRVPLFGLCTRNNAAKRAFEQVVAGMGHRLAVAPWPTSDLLKCDVLVVDLEHPSNAKSLLKKQKIEKPALIGFAPTFSLPHIQTASELKAIDVLYHPLSRERVELCLRASLEGELEIKQEPAVLDFGGGRRRERVLVVSPEATLEARLKVMSSERGIRLEFFHNAEHALKNFQSTSFHGAVYDAVEDMEEAKAFCAALRNLPGIDLLPIVFLVDTKAKGKKLSKLVSRSTWCIRESLEEHLIDRLDSIGEEKTHGRSFVRYRTTLSVQMRYQGLVSEATVVDISRGGVMLACRTQLPPLGAEVALSLTLPSPEPIVHAAGVISRIMLPERGNPTSHVGVGFEAFSANSEKAFLSYLSGLEPLPN